MNLYRHIDRNKVQFDFVKHTGDTGAFEQEILELGGRIFEVPRFKGYNYLNYCKWWHSHLSDHPEHKIIHGHFFTMSAIYFRIAKRYHCITVGHSHSSLPLEKTLKSQIKALLQKRIESVSDFCLACSDAAGKWLFPNREFTVLKNAVSAERFHFDSKTRWAVRKGFGLSDETFVIGIVGSLSDVKNPFGTIEIFKAVHRRNPNAKLLWVGDGGLREEIEKKLREEGLNDAVIMTGVREDVDQLMQAMDIFILPSLWEGLPVVLMEAQTAGLPCFISDTVTKGAAITALCTFLPLDAPEKWADAILLGETPERKDTSQQIKDAGYDIETTAKWLEEFYLDCLS